MRSYSKQPVYRPPLSAQLLRFFECLNALADPRQRVYHFGFLTLIPPMTLRHNFQNAEAPDSPSIKFGRKVVSAGI